MKIEHNINWYPGHMNKARREIREKIQLIDIVVELIDARVPHSSKNPVLDEFTENKVTVLVFTKTDLVDPRKLSFWKDHYENKGYICLFVNLMDQKDIRQIERIFDQQAKIKHEKEAARGLRKRALKSVVIGVPNVGKSTLINKIAKRKASRVANTPGHTKAQQWVSCFDKYELLDTPGILWPRFENAKIGLHLALIGSIKDDLLDHYMLFDYLTNYALDNNCNEYLNRYKIDGRDLAENIAKISKFYGKEDDQYEEMVVKKVIQDFRRGLCGTFLLDSEKDAR